MKLLEFYKCHKRKIKKYSLKVLIFGLISIIIFLYFINFAQKKEKELVEYKLKLVEEGYNKRLEKTELILENLKSQLNIQGEGIWENVSRETDQLFFLNNMTENQKEIQFELHSKNILRYDWMINPVESGIVGTKNSEFYCPRYTNGKFRNHLGLDQNPYKTTEIINSCDGVVDQTGYSEIGGKFIIIKTIRNEFNEKKKKNEDVIYENYYGHLAEINVMQGQEIKQGMRIGIMGNTGPKNIGIHLHWAVKRNGIIMNPIVNTSWNNKIIASSKETGF